MANDLIVPEILLINKMEEMDNSLSVEIWEQMKTDAVCREEEEYGALAPAKRHARKMFFSDFVNKAISIPMEITPKVSDEAYKQIYRLYIFSCQQAIHYPEVRRNPFILGFHALNEIKEALVGIMVTYRLVTPSAPYSWSREFFEKHILIDKGPEGQAIIKFTCMPADAISAAMNEEVVTDWMIYKNFDTNGIRTLMDIKNNLLTLPDYQKGGPAAAEFSRFQRKMAEVRAAKEVKRNDELDLEFRKTLVQSVAEKTAEKLISSGMSTTELLNKVFSTDITKLTSLGENNIELEDNKSNVGKDKMLEACAKRLSKGGYDVEFKIEEMLKDDEE